MTTISKFITILFIANLATAAYATPTLYTVIAPNCLTKNLEDKDNVLATNKKFSLLQVDRKKLDQLIDAKHTSACGGFYNVTQDWHKQAATTSAAKFLHQEVQPAPTIPTHKVPPYQISYTKQVNGLLNQLIPENIWSNLTTLTHFHDRFSNSDNGVAAIAWLQEQVDTMVKNSGRSDVSLHLIATKNYKQSSLIVKIGNSNAPGVVISAHADTLNGVMPGADDDGSGSVSVLEITRLLLNSNLQFDKPIYLMWYAAEEEGLLGSDATVKEFKQQKIAIAAVLHFDMLGFSYKNDPTMWLVQDYTDPELTAYLAELIKIYVKQPVRFTRCGYACSDHASWNRQGYIAGFAYEGEVSKPENNPEGMPAENESEAKDNPYLHTSADTMEKLSLAHISDYAKLGTAFAVEMAKPAKEKN